MIAWLEALAAREGRRIPVRLVKGAYWDSEIKRTQEQGLDDYPVFTRKLATDVSYVACARRLLAGGDAFYPQFATHNAQTLGSIIELAGNRRDFEFQRLHGMGEALYEGLVGAEEGRVACRVYAPVGSHQDLLPYLVRRLLENGANTSFVNRILDENVPLETLVEDPASRLARLEPKRHPRIPLPAELYGPERRNSRGIDLRDPAALDRLAGQLDRAFEPGFQARPGIAGGRGEARAVLDPADRSCAVGSVIETDPETIAQAAREAQAGFASWERTPLAERVACLRRAADLYEANAAELLAWCVREAGKTLPDAVAEVREAVDFLRYYAMEAQTRAAPRELPGPTGEANQLSLHGRGVFVAISPWNFPLAIFTGQIAAALVVGNAVLAKPAPQTPLIAAKAVALLHQAGVPEDALILLPGGPEVGARLVADPGIAGVAFTGSTQTAWAINRALAAKDGPIVPLIAETGGQNAMLVDSSALPEQVVADVLESSFRSAGQRCSALRVLCLQDDIAPRVLEMLAGAMLELEVGDPGLLATDVGPVIDEAARQRLEQHAARMMREGRLIQRVPLRAELARGCFFAPAGVRDRCAHPAGGRGVRADSARGALRRRPAGADGRCDQRDRLRADARRAQPDRSDGRAGAGAGARRQYLRQSQHDRRGGRGAAVRRRAPVRHRPEGRRAALSRPLRHRAHGQRQHRRGRRQRQPAQPRWRSGLSQLAAQPSSSRTPRRRSGPRRAKLAGSSSWVLASTAEVFEGCP